MYTASSHEMSALPPAAPSRPELLEADGGRRRRCMAMKATRRMSGAMTSPPRAARCSIWKPPSSTSTACTAPARMQCKGDMRGEELPRPSSGPQRTSGANGQSFTAKPNYPPSCPEPCFVCANALCGPYRTEADTGCARESTD